MKRLTLACLALLAAAFILRGELLPETIDGLTFTRGEADVAVSGTFQTGTSLLLTNCVAKGVAGAVQDLTDLGGYVKIGNSVTSFSYAVSAQVATSGTWTATATIPTAAQLIPTNIVYSTALKWLSATAPSTVCTVELTLTNATGRVYTYSGGKLITTRSALP